MTAFERRRISNLWPFEVAALYGFLLVPSLSFKWEYVAALESWDAPLPMIGPRTAWLERAWLLFRFVVPADFLDVLVGTLVLYLLLRGLLRLQLRYVAFLSVFLSVLVGSANALSLRELGNFLSRDTLSAAWHWTIGQAGIVTAVLKPVTIVALGAAAAWTTAPLLGWPRSTWQRLLESRRARRVLITSAALAATYATLLGIPQAAAGASGAAAVAGFWSALVRGGVKNVETDLAKLPPADEADLLTAYRRLAYPSGFSPVENPLVKIPLERKRPRHVIIITLETAPSAYYNLADDPALPVFHAMSLRGLVGDRHYATAPTTRLAVDSLITGTYPRPGEPMVRYGDFRSDGLAGALKAEGYETSYIDSFHLRWSGPDEARTVKSLGFDAIDDSKSLPIPPQTSDYDESVVQERRSLEVALDRVVGATARHRHAFVCLTTHLGHYEWVANPAQENLSGRDRVAQFGRVLDNLMGSFIAGLAAHGLTDDVIVVVTGDHGLRFRMEFESLGERPQYGDMTFRVPLLVYAPALFSQRVRVPWVTSHVDLAPTLLDLLGMGRAGKLFHGDNVLEGRLVDRITFQLSGFYPGNHPEDAFQWHGHVYAEYELTRVVTVRAANGTEERSLHEDDTAAFSAPQVRDVHARARGVFDATAAYFLRRARPLTR